MRSVSTKINFDYEYITEQDELSRVKSWLQDKKFFCFDTETTGLNPLQDDVVLLQIGNQDKQWILDARAIDISEMAPYFEDSDWVKLGHGTQFDLKMLMVKGFKFSNMADTAVAEQILRCGLGMRFRMDVLAKHYLRAEIPKDQELRMSFATTGVGQLSQHQLEYAAGDVIYPIYFAKHQKPLIDSRGLRNTLTLEHMVLPVLAQMELEGMRLDTEAWVGLYQEAVQKREEYWDKLNKFFGVSNLKQEDMFGSSEDVYEVNYASWQQLQKAMERKGYFLEGTDSKVIALAAIEEKIPVELAQAIIGYRMYNTKCSRYGLNVLEAIEPSTGHIHGDFTQVLTTSGRLSSGNKSEEKSSMKRINFQNFPGDPRYRHCIIPDEGDAFIIWDLQAIEPRILGDMSLDPTYLKTFREDGDIYQNIGEGLYGEEVSKKPGRPKELRDKTKIGVLGTSYGTGKNKFYRKMLLDMNLDGSRFLKDTITHITQEESDSLWEGIFETCPGIREFLDLSSQLASPSSKRRVWDERMANRPFKKVYTQAKTMLEKSIFTQDMSAEDIEYKATEIAKNRGWVTYSQTLNGRKRFFPSYSTNWYTEGRNHPIQGTAADIVKTAMVEADRIIKTGGYSAAIINQIHDELVVRCKKEETEELSPKIQFAMENAGNKFFRIVPCKATGGIFNRWEKD